MYPGISLWLVLFLLVTSQAANNPEVSWGDWLVVDEAEPGTSILLRRITPKSVFVAPSFNGCSEGYQQDALGRCVKLVKVNQKAQFNFFLERISSMYAPSSTSKQPQKEAGPFHINLPIGSDSSQEDGIVRKRVPPRIRDDIIRTPLVIVQPTTTLPPPTTTQESTTLDTTFPTIYDCSDITTTEKELNFQPDITTESRRITTKSFIDAGGMLENQPIRTEDITEMINQETPKIYKDNSSQQSEKPFVIIVTNEPTEETTTFTTTPLTLQTTMDEERTEVPTEFTTEDTTETTLKYIAETTPRMIEHDILGENNYSETKDIVQTSIRPVIKTNNAHTIRPKCDIGVDPSNCEPNTELLTDTKKVSNPNVQIVGMSRLESHIPVRFPSENVVPVHKPTQTFVRFPDVASPHDDRPAFWWPSWQFRQHPGIHGWPPSDVQSSEQALRQQYPPYTYTWSDSTAWRRRFFQRD